jgi:hypothetical protein
LCISLAGCTGNRARGLDPIIDGAAVQTASNNKAILLAALAADAGYGSPAAADWYAVSEAGFNYVDDQCRAYFDDLFFLERGREQIKSGLSSAAQTTAAILAVTGAASPTLAIVAQAFGFAVNATDVVAGTYLYRLPPATTQGFVQKLQLAFRDAASASRASINSPTSAYYMIQRYLNLCLPPTIEAEIAKQVVSTSAFPVATSNGQFFSIETLSAPPTATPPRTLVGPPPITREVVRRTRISRAIDEAPPRKLPIDKARVDQTFLRQVQVALCVTSITGNLDPTTRAAIQTFYEARTNRRVPEPIDPLGPALLPRLQDAVDDVGSCSERGFVSAYEVAIFGLPEAERISKIKDMQAEIGRLLSRGGSSITVQQTGVLDAQTRRAISEIRSKLGFPSGNYVDKKLYLELTL